MSTLQAAISATLPQKRKRDTISYAELDINDVDDEEEVALEETGRLSDSEDEAYGSRKKPRKSLKGEKRAKLTLQRPKKAKVAKTFPFLSLPAELRDQIYELALTNSDGITVVARTKAGRRTVRRGMIVNTKRHLRGFFNINSIEVPKQDNKLSPRLLEVNKQIRSEGVGWLYKQPIILESTMALHSFVATIGSTNRQIVTDLTIKGWGSGRGTNKTMNTAALTLLSTCTNLESLRFDCTIPSLRWPLRLAKHFYQDGHYFLEALGAAKGDKRAAVDVLELSDAIYPGMFYEGEEFEKLMEQFRAELRRLLG